METFDWESEIAEMGLGSDGDLADLDLVSLMERIGDPMNIRLWSVRAMEEDDAGIEDLSEHVMVAGEPYEADDEGVRTCFDAEERIWRIPVGYTSGRDLPLTASSDGSVFRFSFERFGVLARGSFPTTSSIAEVIRRGLLAFLEARDVWTAEIVATWLSDMEVIDDTYAKSAAYDADTFSTLRFGEFIKVQAGEYPIGFVPEGYMHEVGIEDDGVVEPLRWGGKIIGQATPLRFPDGETRALSAQHVMVVHPRVYDCRAYGETLGLKGTDNPATTFSAGIISWKLRDEGVDFFEPRPFEVGEVVTIRCSNTLGVNITSPGFRAFPGQAGCMTSDSPIATCSGMSGASILAAVDGRCVGIHEGSSGDRAVFRAFTAGMFQSTGEDSSVSESSSARSWFGRLFSGAGPVVAPLAIEDFETCSEVSFSSGVTDHSETALKRWPSGLYIIDVKVRGAERGLRCRIEQLASETLESAEFFEESDLAVLVTAVGSEEMMVGAVRDEDLLEKFRTWTDKVRDEKQRGRSRDDYIARIFDTWMFSIRGPVAIVTNVSFPEAIQVLKEHFSYDPYRSQFFHDLADKLRRDRIGIGVGTAFKGWFVFK